MAKDYDYPRPMQGRLAKQQLASAAFHASRMYDVLEDDDKLPAWVLMKVNTAEDRLRAAADYMRYKAKPGLDAYDAPVVKRGMHAGYGDAEPIRTLTEGDVRHLCVTYETEKTVAQPVRLAATAAGVVVAYAATKMPASPLRTVTQLIGAGMSVWSLGVWLKARKAMTE